MIIEVAVLIAVIGGFLRIDHLLAHLTRQQAVVIQLLTRQQSHLQDAVERLYGIEHHTDRMPKMVDRDREF